MEAGHERMTEHDADNSSLDCGQLRGTGAMVLHAESEVMFNDDTKGARCASPQPYTTQTPPPRRMALTCTQRIKIKPTAPHNAAPLHTQTLQVPVLPLGLCGTALSPARSTRTPPSGPSGSGAAPCAAHTARQAGWPERAESTRGWQRSSIGSRHGGLVLGLRGSRLRSAYCSPVKRGAVRV